jgi:DNA primase
VKYRFDVREYLESRLPGYFIEDGRGWLIGSCLFHNDGRRPNLGVRPETGRYRCLSCGANGDRISLIQRIEGFATYDEAREWFIERYGESDDDDDETITFEIAFDEERREPAAKWNPPNESILAQYKWRHPYVYSRGITELWARRFEIGYDRATLTITFPWRDRKGHLITVKHRRVDDKRFWYSPRVPPGVKNTLLYGLHHVARRRDPAVWICEAEIDCISLWQSGRPAVALGGAFMSATQARELALAGVARVVLACDRDEGGQKAHESIRDRLCLYGIECAEAVWPEDFDGKDVNDLLLVGRIEEMKVLGLNRFLIA